MRLLAIETATLAGGAALLDDGRLVGESRLNIAITHSERLMAVVDRLLQDCGYDVASLDALAVSVGPGSFTGLRVGVATAKGLALALEVEVAPVPTLDALAATLPFAGAPVCPLLSARRHGSQSMEMVLDFYAYSAWFDPERSGKLIFPYWRVLGEHLRSVVGSPLRPDQKLRCASFLLRWLWTARGWLRGELKTGALVLTGRRRLPTS